MAVFFRFSIAFFSFFLFPFFSQAQNKLTADQKALLKEALRVAVSDDYFLQEYPELQTREKTITLYDKMISLEEPDKAPVFLTDKMVPKFRDITFDLKTHDEIFDPERREDLVFLRVMQINQPEGDFGIVTVLSQIALGNESREKGFLHKQSNGKTMLFKRVKKGWKFDKLVNNFPNLVDYKLPY